MFELAPQKKKEVTIGLWSRWNPTTDETSNNYKDSVTIPLDDDKVSELNVSKEIFTQIKEYIKNNSI